ncbi:MAG TPA: N-acetylmuramoyl-L-alanine amidase [Alphaproteobacteria bacterium]|nr:N-acetylmuramoyl-L-alanine amidase [Alphaproteobacteria bacterium]HNS44965.1 N-acetylmuramoyl-L-alanine amidase [Alphaproteobacteria bacterium]
MIRPVRSVFLSLLFLVLLAAVQSAFALDIKSVRFGAHPDKQRAVIELTAPTQFRAFILGGPNRIVIDMDDFAWKAGTIPHAQGVSVSDVRFGSLGGGKGRLVFETNSPVMIQSAFLLPKQGSQPDRLVVDFQATSATISSEAGSQVMGNMRASAPEQSFDIASASIGGIPLPPRKGQVSPPARSQTFIPPAQKPLVIIDAGHGGQDPGARGANGMYEKTIVLAVAHELRKQLEDSGKYRVKMTRESDVFIPLRGRVNFARKNKGDLFISLHADSIRDSNVTGASVYTLSDKASDKETEKLAERENKSDLIAGIDLSHQEDDVANILIDLAARDTMNQSKFLANTVVQHFRTNSIKTLEGAHRSAGFAVLKAMDIPSILIEMGYLTNRGEVERLSSPQHRQKIAATIKKSIDAYFQKTSA